MPHVPYASTLIIPQWWVEEILCERLAILGGTVEFLDQGLRSLLRFSDSAK